MEGTFDTTYYSVPKWVPRHKSDAAVGLIRIWWSDSGWGRVSSFGVVDLSD